MALISCDGLACRHLDHLCRLVILTLMIIQDEKDDVGLISNVNTCSALFDLSWCASRLLCIFCDRGFGLESLSPGHSSSERGRMTADVRWLSNISRQTPSFSSNCSLNLRQIIVRGISESRDEMLSYTLCTVKYQAKAISSHL